MLEDRVLEDAIRWFEEDVSRYTPDTYLQMERGSGEGERPGLQVVAACAIGGVEQALWRVTGKVVSDDREMAYAGTEKYSGGRPEGELGLYWGVMRRLNLEARRRAEEGLYDEFFWEDVASEAEAHREALVVVRDVEDVTTLSSDDTRELMLDVFRAALATDPALVPAG